MGFVIRQDYHAIHHSGTRRLAQIELLVIHDMENVSYNRAAENVGAWFENVASGGSSHYGIDNDSIQRYLALNVIAWGAPHANTDGVHLELMGRAAWTKQQWMENAHGTLDRAAWVLARVQRYLRVRGVRIPLHYLTDAELAIGKHGITSHRQVTRVFGGGTHTDPGTGFPRYWLAARAQHWASLL